MINQNEKMKTKAEGPRLTLVTFWYFLAKNVHLKITETKINLRVLSDGVKVKPEISNAHLLSDFF